MTYIHQQRSGAPFPGALLGNYRIIEPLDRGGTGSVFRAEHSVLGRPAAVKILRPELTTNPELVHRFLVEARAATLIRHPGIVEVYDCATTEDGTSYIAMELLEGSTLAARLAERGRLPETEVAFISRGIASALKAAHRGGIIHRDLKPENIFLVPDPDGPTGERVKVLDFGIAKLMDPKRVFQTQTGALIGTPSYMPPEQARAASAIDHRADLYSLGCMMFEMLAGRPPFVAQGAGELISMHLMTPPQPPSTLVSVSPAMERIVLRLLEKDPAARFRDAGELTEALDAVLGPLIGVAARAGAAAAAGDSQPYAVPGLGGAMPLSIADERRHDQREPGSSMGLVAGIITVAIMAAVGLFIAMRGGGGDDEAKPAAAGASAGSAGSVGEGGSAGSAPAPDPAAPAPPKEASTPPPPPPPTPAPRPAKEASTPKPAERPAVTPKEPRTTKPAQTGSTRGKRPAPKPGGASGPVTRPDGPVTKPDSGGPVTSPSSTLRSPGGSPINPPESLNENKKPPPPRPVEQPPAAPPDKLPDKPSAPHDGVP